MTKTSKAYIVKYDNGEFYEDWNEKILFVTTSRHYALHWCDNMNKELRAAETTYRDIYNAFAEGDYECWSDAPEELSKMHDICIEKLNELPCASEWGIGTQKYIWEAVEYREED